MNHEEKTSKIIAGIAGSLAILIMAQLLSQLPALGLTRLSLPAFLANAVAGICYAGIAFFLLKLFARRILHCPLSSLGIPRFCIRGRWLAVAVLLPVAVTAFFFLLPGTFLPADMTLNQALTSLSAGVFFTGLAAGIVEELVFRGVIMHLLAGKTGWRAAIFFPSLLFGLVHLPGAGLSLRDSLQVLAAGTLAGIMFSLVARASSVWNSAAVHALWNIVVLGGFLHIGKSPDSWSLVSYILKTDSFLLTGGTFGLEASLAAIAGYHAVSLLACRSRTSSPDWAVPPGRTHPRYPAWKPHKARR